MMLESVVRSLGWTVPTMAMMKYAIVFSNMHLSIWPRPARDDQTAQFASSQTRPHWPPFFVHNKLCKNDTQALWNWDDIFEWLLKLGLFELAKSSDWITCSVLIVAPVLAVVDDRCVFLTLSGAFSIMRRIIVDRSDGRWRTLMRNRCRVVPWAVYVWAEDEVTINLSWTCLLWYIIAYILVYW